MKVTVATGAGEGVCLSVVPLKVRAKGSNQPAIGAYALLDSGSEVTLCHERLKKQLVASGRKLDFTLSGMTGSTKVRSELIDIEVASLDGKTLIEVSNVRTVNQMPISEACIAKKEDVRSWSHLRDLPLQELETREVMLVIGLQENSSIFLPLEYRSGEEKDPVAIRYSLGWTVIGPVGEKMDGMCATTNPSLLLKKRLLRDYELLKKYRTTLNEYLEKGYAEKIPQEQLDMENRPIWYLPHHLVTHPLKPEKVGVVYDCATSYGRTSLNQQLLQGPDQTNHLTGVLI